MDVVSYAGEIYVNGQPATPEQRYQINKEILKQSLYCGSLVKFLSVILYVTLTITVAYLAAHYGSLMKLILTILTAIPIPFEILNALLLLIIAYHEQLNKIDCAIWIAILKGTYNIGLGIFGAIEFSRTAKLRHFVLAFSYFCLTFGIFGVLCFDVKVLYSFKKLLRNPQGYEDGNILNNNIIFAPTPTSMVTPKNYPPYPSNSPPNPYYPPNSRI